MKLGKTLALALVVPAAARVIIGCADDFSASLENVPDGGQPDAFVAADASTEDVADASELPDGAADGGIPCSPDGFCHTRLPARETFDAGDLAPDLPVSFDLVDVSVLPGGSAWAVSAGGHVLEWRGEAWSVVHVVSTQLKKVWAATADDVWIAGNSGFVMHGTRTPGAPMTFEDASIGGFGAILGLAGVDDEVWAYANNILYRRVTTEDGGGAWAVTAYPFSVPGTSPAAQLTGMWRGPTGQLWLTGRVYNSCFSGCQYVSRGALWRRTVVDSVVGFEEVPFTTEGISYTGVIAGADRGGHPVVCIGQPCASVLHVADDGTTTTEKTGLSEGSIEAAWASGPDDAWLVGSPGVVRRWNGAEWTYARVTVTSAPVVKPLHAVNGAVSESGVIDMWIVGKDTALHRTVKP